jgi:hypothetical protein
MSGKKYSWDAKSAMRKATSDVTLNVGTGFVSVSKQITSSHDPKKDAYRSCKNCGKHINYHKDGKCPK